MNFSKLSHLRRRVDLGYYVEDRYSDAELLIYRRLLFLKWLLVMGRLGEFF